VVKEMVVKHERATSTAQDFCHQIRQLITSENLQAHTCSIRKCFRGIASDKTDQIMTTMVQAQFKFYV